MKIKCFVVMFNHLTWAKILCEQLSDTGCEVILIDNTSTYPPLLDWYKACPYKIIHMPYNARGFGFFKNKLYETFDDRYYMLTDHDISIDGVPDDYIDVLMNGLSSTKEFKAGLSIEINDLPENDYTKKVVEWESNNWVTQENGFYKASVATTLALYDKLRVNDDLYSGIRAPRPYTCKHLPWYLTKEMLNSEEEKFYISASQNNGWNKLAHNLIGKP